MNLGKRRSSQRKAVSPVIAVVLLVAVTVVLSAGTYLALSETLPADNDGTHGSAAVKFERTDGGLHVQVVTLPTSANVALQYTDEAGTTHNIPLSTVGETHTLSPKTGSTVQVVGSEGSSLIQSYHVSAVSTSEELLMDGLIARFPFNESSTSVAEELISDADATFGGDPSYEVLASGTTVLTFDGSGDQATVSATDAPQPTGNEATYSIWFYKTGGGGGSTLNPGVYYHGTTHLVFWDNHGNGELAATFGISGSRQTAVTDYDIPEHSWHHAVATYDGSTIRLYIDKEVVATKEVSGTLDTQDATFIIGDKIHNQDYFVGQLSDLRVYDYALTPTEIETLYAETAP